MLRNFTMFLSLVFTLLLSPIANAELVEGDISPNPSLVQITPAGNDSSHGILWTTTPGEFVLLDFFSVTCGYCVRDLPKIAGFAREIAGKATVRIIGVDRDEARMRRYRNENPASFPYDFALDPTRSTMRAFGVTGTPTYYLVDSVSGRIVFAKLGSLEPADLDRVRDLIGAPRN